MAKNSVRNPGRAGPRRARDPRRFGRPTSPRLPLRAAWTVTLLLLPRTLGCDLARGLVIGLGFAVGAPMSNL